MWDLSKKLLEKNGPPLKKNGLHTSVWCDLWCVLLLDEIHGGFHTPNLHLTCSFKKSFGLGMLRTEINRTGYIFFKKKLTADCWMVYILWAGRVAPSNIHAVVSFVLLAPGGCVSSSATNSSLQHSTCRWLDMHGAMRHDMRMDNTKSQQK